MATVNLDVILEGQQAKTEAAAIDESLDNIGKAGKQSGTEAAAGLNKTEQAARSTAQSVGSASQAARGYENALKANEATIKSNRAELAQLNQKLVELKNAGQGSTDAAKAIAAQMATLRAQTAVTSAENIKLKDTLVETTSAWSRKTSMINTGGGALRGYDAIVQNVVRSFGGITVLWAVALQLGASLLPVILNLGKAEKEKIEIDKEAIRIDLQRVDTQSRIARTNADLISAFVVLANEQEKYQASTKQLRTALSDLETTGRRTRVMHGQLSEGTVLITASSEGLREETTQLNSEIGKQEKTMAPAIDTLLTYRDATGKSTEQVIQLAKQTGRFAEETLQFFREQLNATIPFVGALGDALDKLSVPQFNIAATPQGIQELNDAVLAGLTATFEKGIGGTATKVADFDAQVRAIAPTLRALDEALKRNSGSQAEYNRQLGDLKIPVQTALENFKRQEEAYKKNFETRKKAAFDILSLEREARIASIKAEMEGLEEKEALIRADFGFRRRELEKNGNLNATTLALLGAIELRQLTEVTNEKIRLYHKEQFERTRFIEEGRETRLRLEREAWEKERRLIIQRGRETRILLEVQDKASRERRSGRDTRREMEAEEIRRQANELARVSRVFGQASKNAELYRQQVALLNGELNEQQAQLVILKSSLEQFVDEWILSGKIFAEVGAGIGDALAGVIANGENFGAAMKAMFLNLIADIAAYWGQLYISMGAGMLLFDPGRGARLIAAGAALLILAGALRGLAGLVQKNAQQASGGGGAAAGGGSGSAAGGGGGGTAAAAPTERSKFSPGPELTGAARIAEIDRRLQTLDRAIEQANGILRRYLTRQVELLNQERAALGAIGTAAEIVARSRTPRVPINASGPGSAPVFVINFDSKDTARLVTDALVSNGVVTVRSTDGRHRSQLKKKMKKMR